MFYLQKPVVDRGLGTQAEERPGDAEGSAASKADFHARADSEVVVTKIGQLSDDCRLLLFTETDAAQNRKNELLQKDQSETRMPLENSGAQGPL